MAALGGKRSLARSSGPHNLRTTIDTILGAAGLLDFLPDEQLPSATLLELTQDKSKTATRAQRCAESSRALIIYPLSEVNFRANWD